MSDKQERESMECIASHFDGVSSLSPISSLVISRNHAGHGLARISHATQFGLVPDLTHHYPNQSTPDPGASSSFLALHARGLAEIWTSQRCWDSTLLGVSFLQNTRGSLQLTALWSPFSASEPVRPALISLHKRTIFLSGPVSSTFLFLVWFPPSHTQILFILLI